MALRSAGGMQNMRPSSFALTPSSAYGNHGLCRFPLANEMQILECTMRWIAYEQ